MVEFRILGPLEVVDHESLALGGHKQRAVLAVLLLHRGEAVAADRLIEAVWAGPGPVTAGKTLQVYVSNLRKVLGDGLLVTQGRGYVLAVQPDQVDSDRFEELAARGREALDRGDPQTAQTWLHAALSLWRGPALVDFSYESFAQSEIARLEEVRMSALESRIDADLRLGRHSALVPELEALVHDHPLRERLYEQLMVALYRSGRQVDALERYQRARRKLIDEFGIEPGPRLQDVQRAVLTHDATLDLAGSGSSLPRPRHGAQRAGQRVRQRLTALQPRLSGVRQRLKAVPQRPKAVPQRPKAVPQRLSALRLKLSGAQPRLSGARRRLSGARRRLSGVARRPSAVSDAVAGLPAVLERLVRQAAGAKWLIAGVGVLLIIAVVLAVTLGGHSRAPAHKRAVVNWVGISAPTAGGVYPQGEWVATSFSCGQTSGGSGLKSCSDSTGTDTVSGGHGHLDTSTTGLHRYWVAARAKYGAAKATSITYTVVPPLKASIESAVATAAHGRTNVTLACSGGGTGAECRGTLTLSTGRRAAHRVGRRRTVTVETVKLAGTVYSLAGGARRSIGVWLTNAGILALRTAPGHQLRAQATITLTGGKTAVQPITLRRRRQRG